MVAVDENLDTCGDLSSHQSKYVWFCERPRPAQWTPEETSSCPNTPGASGDVQGPLKTPPMRRILSRFLYKLKTGFLTFCRAVFAALAREKLEGA